MRRAASLPLPTRTACALAAYLIYVIAAWLILQIVIAYTQAHGITSFYELAPDELPGPMGMGDPAHDWFVIGSYYALFLVSMTPVFWLLSGPWLLFAILLVLNLPLSFCIFVITVLLIGR